MERYQYNDRDILGRGGMGIVYKAWDTQTKQWVALKVMTGYPEDDARDQKARERFSREVKIARELQHEYILPLIDEGIFRFGGRIHPYLVSPYKKDGSLAQVLRDHPSWESWTLRQVADVIKQAADALQYMHDQTSPKVHGDVKPANFLVDYLDTPERIVHLYLSDFGITREQKGPLDIASEVIVSLYYMAPEQLSGIITPASDQYSLAVVTCYLLTGKFPYRSASDTGLHHPDRFDGLIPPGQLTNARKFPREVDLILLKALEKRPANRHPSILAFAELLQQAMLQQVDHNEATVAFAADATDELLRRNSNDAQAEGLNQPPPFMVNEQAFRDVTINPPSVVVQPKAPPELPAAESLARSGETRRATLPLHQFRPVISIALPGRPRMISWSRDGNLLIGTFFSHPPLLMNRNGETKMLPTGIARAACWNPAGRLLAVSIPTPQRSQASSQAQIWDSYAPTRPLLTLPLHAREIDGLDWSITGELAAWEEQQIKLFHVTQRHPQQAQEGITRTISTPTGVTCGNTDTLRWSPDGKWLAAGAKNGTIICWHGQTRTIHHQIQSQGQFVYCLAWSSDSALLAAAFNDHHIEVWNVAEKRRVTQWRDLPHIPRALSFSIHNTLVIASNTQELVLGNARDAGPSTSHAGHWVAAWSPTRAELATLDAQTGSDLIVWEAPTQQS